MTGTSFDFLNGINPSLKRKIEPMFVSVVNLMEQYKIHIKETPESEQKSPEEFLTEQGIVVEMFARQFDCYDDVLWILREWTKN